MNEIVSETCIEISFSLPDLLVVLSETVLRRSGDQGNPISYSTYNLKD